MKRISTAGFLGRAQQYIKNKIQGIVGRAGGKFDKAIKFMSKAKQGVKGLAKLGSAGEALSHS